MENLVLVTFDQPERSYKALSELRRLSGVGALSLRAAAVVERLADGRFQVPDTADNTGIRATAVGGGIGALVGALVGPLGILLGGAVGLTVGSLADVEEADRAEVLLTAVSSRIPRGTTAVVADVDEPTPEVIDSVMAGMDGAVHRWPRWEVEDELAAAEEALRAAEAEARRVLRERRRAEGRETLGDKLGELKDRITGRT